MQIIDPRNPKRRDDTGGKASPQKKPVHGAVSVSAASRADRSSLSQARSVAPVPASTPATVPAPPAADNTAAADNVFHSGASASALPVQPASPKPMPSKHSEIRVPSDRTVSTHPEAQSLSGNTESTKEVPALFVPPISAARADNSAVRRESLKTEDKKPIANQKQQAKIPQHPPRPQQQSSQNAPNKITDIPLVPSASPGSPVASARSSLVLPEISVPAPGSIPVASVSPAAPADISTNTRTSAPTASGASSLITPPRSDDRAQSQKSPSPVQSQPESGSSHTQEQPSQKADLPLQTQDSNRVYIDAAAPRAPQKRPLSHLAFDNQSDGVSSPHEFVAPDGAADSPVSEILGERKLSRSELSQLSKKEQKEYKRARKENKKATKQAKKRRRRSKRKAPVWQVIMLIIGIGLLAYPIVADRISAFQADEAIQSYTMQISEDPEVINQLMAEAEAYNDRLSGTPNNYDGEVRSEDQLIVAGGLPFAWIEFPTLGEQLPIYHGTDESSLQSGVGHLERTSIPIGGNSTHSVLTGHSGMPGSRMFDDIDRLEVGEVFFIHILDRDLAYQVISSEVVWPDEVESLVIQQDRDLVTLITCTPYGVNDHRLLVHAERTDYDEALSLPSNNMALFFNQRTMPFILAIIITVLFFVMLSIHRRRRYPLELGVDKAWNGLSDYTDDKRRFIGYRDAT